MDGTTAPVKSKVNPRLWLIFLILLPLLVYTFKITNNDFETIAAIVRDWFMGKVALYSAESVYFNYTPWLLLIYLPLSFIPRPFGLLVLNTISLCLLIWSTWYLAKPISWKPLAIALSTLYTCRLLIQGQGDAFGLAALVVGWIGYQRKNPWLIGISLLGMTFKPTNIFIPLLLLLVAIYSWPIKKLLTAAVIPLVTLGISFIVAGWDWPIRYIRLLITTAAYFHYYQVETIFSTVMIPISYRLIVPPFGFITIILCAIISLFLLIKVSRKGVQLESLNLALALNLVVSPYFTFHHIIYLAPVHAQLLNKYRLWGLVLFGFALVDVLLLWLGIGLITYPLAALIILIIITIRRLYLSKAPVSDLVETGSAG